MLEYGVFHVKMEPEQWNGMEERGPPNSIIPINAAKVSGLPLYECLLNPEIGGKRERKLERTILKGWEEEMIFCRHLLTSGAARDPADFHSLWRLSAVRF